MRPDGGRGAGPDCGRCVFTIIISLCFVSTDGLEAEERRVWPFVWHFAPVTHSHKHKHIGINKRVVGCYKFGRAEGFNERSHRDGCFFGFFFFRP